MPCDLLLPIVISLFEEVDFGVDSFLFETGDKLRLGISDVVPRALDLPGQDVGGDFGLEGYKIRTTGLVRPDDYISLFLEFGCGAIFYSHDQGSKISFSYGTTPCAAGGDSPCDEKGTNLIKIRGPNLNLVIYMYYVNKLSFSL